MGDDWLATWQAHLAAMRMTGEVKVETVICRHVRQLQSGPECCPSIAPSSHISIFANACTTVESPWSTATRCTPSSPSSSSEPTRTKSIIRREDPRTLQTLSAAVGCAGEILVNVVGNLALLLDIYREAIEARVAGLT